MIFPEAFTTSRLRFARLTADDFDELHRMHTDPEVMATMGGVRTEEQTRAYLDKNLRHWDRYNFGLWLVRPAGDDGVIGRALLRHLFLDSADEIEVGYALYAPYWGHGLATEIASACVGFGRHELGWASIVAVTRPDNLRSQRVMRKVGMAYERHFVHEGHEAVLFRTKSEAR
jgi:RimJ/RimL family protein N-acetyltransferase